MRPRGSGSSLSSRFFPYGLLVISLWTGTRFSRAQETTTQQAPTGQDGATLSSPVFKTPSGDETADRALWLDLQHQNTALLRTDPKTVTDRYLAFLRAGATSTPALHPAAAIKAWDLTIDLMDRNVKDANAALALCEEALSLYGKAPTGAALIAAKTRTLLYDNRPQDAQTYIEANWTTITHAPAAYARRILWYDCLTLQALDKSESIPAAIEKMLVQNPALLDEDAQSTNAWMYRRLVSALLAQGKKNEALSWAKVRWMECPFQAAQIQGAASLLAQVWQAPEGNAPGDGAHGKVAGENATTDLKAPTALAAPIPSPSLVQFVRSQGETRVANPLAGVALPLTDAQSVQTQLARLSAHPGDASFAQQAHDRVSLLILMADWAGAMAQAHQEWMNATTMAAGVGDIARVYKAHDLNLVRANAFLAWSQHPQGANPLESFLTEDMARSQQALLKAEPVALPAQSSPQPPTPATSSLLPVALITDPAQWQSGAERLDDVAFDLSRPDVLHASPFEEMVRQDLLKLMTDLKNEDISLDEAAKNPNLPTERWIGYGFAAAGDARAVPFLEDELKQTAKPVITKSKAVDLTYLLICLSSYYEKQGDLTTAAQTQLRVLDYIPKEQLPADSAGAKVPVAGMMANQLIAAARLYERAGNASKARELYSQVAGYGYAWATGMALYDQARTLMNQGQMDAARQLLQQPVEGQYADQVKVGLQVALGASYYRTGEFDKAKAYSQGALDSYKALANPLQGENLETLVDLAKQRITWGDKWKKAPLLTLPETLSFSIPTAGTATQRLALHSLKEVPLSVACDDARIQLGTVTKGWAEELSYVKKVDVTVTLSPMAPQRGFETTLLVSSPTFPGLTLRVPIKVQVGETP